MATDPQLPAGYYLNNFKSLLSFVTARYSDVLSEAERAWCAAFAAARPDAQRLYVRLLGRRGDVQRSDRIAYDEIGDIGKAASELAAAGLLEIDREADLASLLTLLRKAELLGLVAQPGLGRLRRGELLAIAAELEPAVVRSYCARRFRTFRALGREKLAMFMVCYFGNTWQDLSTFVTSDLGIVRFADYTLDRATRPISNRIGLLRIVRRSAIHQQLEASGNNLTREQLAALFRDALACRGPDTQPGADRDNRGADRAIVAVARQMERFAGNDPDDLRTALQMYAATDLPPARERTCRILRKLGHADEAGALAADMARQPRDASEETFGRTYGRRGRMCPVPRVPMAVSRVADVSVEQAVCDRLRHAGEDARFVENALVPGLFGLSFWDVIFAPVPGAFYNPYQAGPSDLFEPGFVPARRGLFEARAAAVATGAWNAADAVKVLREQFGVRNLLVDWRALDAELVVKAWDRLGGATLSLLFRRLALDLRAHRSGWPDIVGFPADGGFRFLEVKAPGDRLQPQQTRWLRFFADAGIPAAVLDISWT